MVTGKKGVVFTNWSKTFSCKPAQYFQPKTAQEIREILLKAKAENRRVKVVGGGHSPSDVACTDDFMLSMVDFNQILEIAVMKKTITVQAGISLKDLNACLDRHGLAMQNLCSVDFVSVGGMMATGTHGSGAKFGILSSLVLELELMTSWGEIISCSEHQNKEIFNAALVSLGAIGVILSVKLQCEPSFRILESTFSRTLDETLDTFETEMQKSDHYKFLYYPHADRCVNVHASRSTKAICNNPSWFWTTLINFHLYKVLLYIATFFPVMLAVINRVFHYLFWRKPQERCDQSYKILHFNCLFSQSVTEWSIPRSETANVLRRFRDAIVQNNIYVHFPVEVRFAKADNICMSPCYGRDTTFLNIISYRPFSRDAPYREQYWHLYESICASVGGRPHWAKAHKANPDYFKRVFPEYDNFMAIRKQLDPDGVFLNEYLERHILGTRSIQI